MTNHSEKWLRDFAAGVSLTYDVLMEGAETWVRVHDGKLGGDYLCFGALLESLSVPEEFWVHYEEVTKTVRPTKYFWDAIRGPWKLYGIWYKQRVFIGVSVISKGEVWEDR